jgi:Secretion system C-terminal sorting domain
MKRVVFFMTLLLCGRELYSQSLEVSETPDHYQISPNQILRIPLRIKNSSEKAQVYIIRAIKGDMGDSQKGYFCLGNNCMDASVEEFSKKLEPGETLTDLHYSFESGIQANQTSLKIEVLPKYAPAEMIERSISLMVEEKPGRSFIFQSKEITIQDVYPNPVQDQAFIDYKIHTEAVKAKIILHNVLGKPMGDYELPNTETKVKIQADELVPGIYFYTVYLNNNGILTRKLVVRK